jgi:uncharacterized protein
MANQDELVFFGDHFEWQRSKAKKNLVNHKVSFEKATEVFFFGETQYYTDELHSFDERRFYAVGYTTEGKLLVVCYTERTRFHIISARRANAGERKDYEEKRGEFKGYGF